MILAGTPAIVTLSGTFLVTTAPAPIVTSFSIKTLPIKHTFGPMYTLSPIMAAGPELLPIVVNCDKLTLFPIIVVGFTTIDMLCSKILRYMQVIVEPPPPRRSGGLVTEHP